VKENREKDYKEKRKKNERIKRRKEEEKNKDISIITNFVKAILENLERSSSPYPGLRNSLTFSIFNNAKQNCNKIYIKKN
jgi:hypothetical protein